MNRREIAQLAKDIDDKTIDLSVNMLTLRRALEVPRLKEVIYSGPVTVCKWDDGTKTLTRCQEGDTYSKQTGLLMCLVKKAYPDWHGMLKKHCWGE